MAEKTFTTQRLFIRRWNEDDAQDLFNYAKDPDVGPAAGWPPHKTINESRDVIKNVFSNPECYAVCLKEDRKAIGSIELKLHGNSSLTSGTDECELGFCLSKTFWGQGIIPEASKEMLRYAFEELNMKKVWIGYYEGNEKSKRAQAKIGFTFVRKDTAVDVPLLEEKRDVYVSVMTREQWKETK